MTTARSKNAIPTKSKSAPSTANPNPKLANDRDIPKKSNSSTTDYKARVERQAIITDFEKKFDKSKRNCNEHQKSTEKCQVNLDDFTNRITSLETEFLRSINQCENLADMLVSTNPSADRQINEHKEKIESLEAQVVSRSQESTISCGNEDDEFTELLDKLDVCINVMVEQKESKILAQLNEVISKEAQNESDEAAMVQECAELFKQEGKDTKQVAEAPLEDETNLYVHQANAPIFAGCVWTVMAMIVVYVYWAEL